ncbi:MAG: phosphatase PAP2 family protein [Nanoarchaeota archaeon]|nr:phosphatase PAP2 family protein [Nanoarchaeota archaeon]
MKKWVIYLIGLILLIISFIFDKQIVNFFINLRVDFLNPVFVFIGTITEWPILFIVTALVIYFKGKKLLTRFVFTYFATLIIILIIRIITRIPRPSTSLVDASTLSFGYSFPSGHTTTAFLLLPLFINLYPKKKFLWIMLAVLIAISRLYIGVHYLSDVIFGAFLGYSMSYFLLKNVKRKNS